MQVRKNPIHLQVALDVGGAAVLLNIARQVADYVDWLEAGTPWILSEGMDAVRILRATFPDKFIVADMKIMDSGLHEAGLGFAAGADLVTVLGVASDTTIREALLAAREYDRFVMVDLIQVGDLAARAREVAGLGANYVGIHTAYDDQKSGRDPLSDLALVAQAISTPLVVAGGIGPHNIERVATLRPGTIVVGGAVTGAPDPRATAQQLRQVVARLQSARGE